jgi:hypothetical protein
LNLSDGGHIENLAVYELLRRRCKFIVCVDGGMEPGMECEDLMRLERYAAIDLGIRMHYGLADLVLQPNGNSRAYGVLVKIDYNPPKNETERLDRKCDAEWGWMLFIKLAMIVYGPGFVMDYKRQYPSFPHESTSDQIYDEAQFEAYRAFGEVAGESLFTQDIIEGWNAGNVEEWFKVLASNLLPDNDEVFSSGKKRPKLPRRDFASLGSAGGARRRKSAPICLSPSNALERAPSPMRKTPRAGRNASAFDTPPKRPTPEASPGLMNWPLPSLRSRAPPGRVRSLMK